MTGARTTWADVERPRLVVVEGIMGSGKSTTVQYIASYLLSRNLPAEPVTEIVNPHPVRATDDLSHFYQPWIDVTAPELAERSLAKWRRFVELTRARETLPVVDGQMFHGDLTNLFVMDLGLDAIVCYSRALEDIVRPLGPLLVYLYQDDVEQAIRTIAARRGPDWVKYQVDWKLQAPYCRRLGLSGLEGLIALYKDYRALTDDLYAKLGLAKVAIESSGQTWPAYYERTVREVLPGETTRE
jgi:hypothetical protein